MTGLATTDTSQVTSLVPYTVHRLRRLRVAADGSTYAFRYPNNIEGLLHLDTATGAILEEWPIVSLPSGEFALGPTGEEAYVLRRYFPNAQSSSRAELVKISLVTGQRSRMRLFPEGIHMPYFTQNGDPTGHTLATVVIPDVDSDFDGTPNHAEVLAGYNPFDYASRPGGPKVYVSFPQAPHPALTVLRVDLYDPDGVFTPAGGLDFRTFSIVADHAKTFGEIELLPDLLGALLTSQTSPDGTKLTLEFDGAALAFPEDTGITASIADTTGARGWDWHRIP